MSELIGLRQSTTKVLVATGMRGIKGGRGLPGEPGTPGAPGTPGTPGTDGRGITSIAVSEDGRLLISYSDGSQQDAGALPGADTAELEAQIADLTARVEALESGVGPVVPPDAAVDGSGQVLVDSGGVTLIIGG